MKKTGMVLTAIFILTSALGDDTEEVRFFENRIRPILVEHCYECHSSQAGKSKGGLLLDSREGIRKGGDSGPAVVPGSVQDSWLIGAISHTEPDLEMPPKKPRLPDAVVEDFRKWIEKGAVDPRESTELSLAQSENHWSYQPVRKPDVPIISSSKKAIREIDRFVLAKLKENNLSPSPKAEPHVLLRRLCFDLVGLPPTTEQMENFSLGDVEKTVDELLASDGFGVRWGRHWLDVVRYAESNGREANIIYPHAWRYRDYVIDSVNRDVPYNRFLMEQIAGDLLPYETESERADLLVATGFLAIGAKGLGNQDQEQFAADLVDEQLDALSRAFLATSIACARCHDHKSDPVSMEDYYSLIGIFKSTKTYYGTWVDSENNNGGELIRLPDLPDQLVPGNGITKEKVVEMKGKLAQLDEDEQRGKEMAEQARKSGADTRMDFNAMLREALRIIWTRGGLEGRLATVDDEGNPIPLCMGTREAKEKVDSPVYARGDIQSPGEAVPRGVPALFSMESAFPKKASESGRLELAKWITDPSHPLTARVMVNRIWSHLFGKGIVETLDNFGPTGKSPSHSELLDFLADQFVKNGWSVKTLVREIVLSDAYQQSSDFREAAFEEDPENRLLWRASKRRLDAEVIRDSMLAASGQLNPEPESASLAAKVRQHSVAVIGFDKSIPKDLDGSNRRSVYLPVFRENLPDVLELFDFAEPSLVMGEREETNVPLQALYLMNSEFVTNQAAALAERISKENSTRAEQISLAFQLCYNRFPDNAEIELIQNFFDESGSEESEALRQFCQSLFCSAEFRISD